MLAKIKAKITYYKSFYGKYRSEVPSTAKIIFLWAWWRIDAFLFGCNFTNFVELCFDKMPVWEKKQYYLRGQEVKVVKAFGDEALEMEYNSKRKEYEALKPFFGRDQLFSKDCTWEEFLEFVELHPQFLVKPDDTDCGDGIRLFDVSNYSTDDKKQLFEELKQEDSIIDERIVQHHKLDELCPGSVNTVRFVTVKIGGG